ncbi:MAG TPA: cobalt-precorrin-6A reductase [Acetobacteraceae bacterium]
MLKLLILGGTTEASALARALAGDSRLDAILSFAGVTNAPRQPPIPWRKGGFGGVEGLVSYLQNAKIELLIDATHPFATQMKRHAAAASQIAKIPLLAILRPPWQPESGDRWTIVADMPEAARALGAAPRRVLLTIGQKDLAAFHAPQHRYIIRSVDPPVMPPPNAMLITARGPFDEAEEMALMTRHGIDILVTKNSGGTATAPKLAAARKLGVAVIMVARPPPPEMETVPDAEVALRWLNHAAARRGV